jgi:hypothetical protein
MNTSHPATASSAEPVVSPQFQWHRKPTGWAGAPCPVCGCTTKRLRALHRALTAEESLVLGTLWIKKIKVCFGLDSTEERLTGR